MDEIKVYGPYERGDGRKHVILYNVRLQERTTVSYPKYLMEQHLGRKLEDWETVDHINENHTDDRIENLQILSRPDNIRKSAKPAETITFICPMCSCEATKLAKDVRHNRNQGRKGPYCSRECARRFRVQEENEREKELLKSITDPRAQIGKGS